MFTGIVEELGEVKRISKQGNMTLLEVKAKRALENVHIGDSVAVNGACLTVAAKNNDSLVFSVMPETMKGTDFVSLKLNEKVNLERALKVGDRLSGHFVTGHIDCIGIIRKKGYSGDNFSFEIAIPPGYQKYLLHKGSIAVEGISLTLARVTPPAFSVYIIPQTLENTNLNFKGPSDKVNIEFDILAKSAAAK